MPVTNEGSSTNGITAEKVSVTGWGVDLSDTSHFFLKNCSPYLGIDEPIGVDMFHFGLTRLLKTPCEGKPAPTARSIPYDYKWQFPRTGGCLQLKQRGFGMST